MGLQAAGRRLSRRQLFFATPAAVAGPAVDADVPERVVDGAACVTGVVEVVHGSSGLTIRSPARRRTVRVVVAANARVDHEGAARVADFVPGEEVFADGAWDGADFVATSVVIVRDIGAEAR